MSYSDLKAFRARLGGSIPPANQSQDSTLQLSLDWGQEFIENHTHRKFRAFRETHYFGPDALDTSPLPFTPRGGLDYTDPLLRRVGWSQWPYRRLYLDQDLLQIYSVTNGDSTVIPNTGYWPEPRNETPHYSIWLKSDFAWTWDTDGWVAIDADWGYSRAPSAMIQGCELRLAEFHYRMRAPTANLQPLWEGTTKGSQVPEGFPLDVIKILDPLKRLTR